MTCSVESTLGTFLGIMNYSTTSIAFLSGRIRRNHAEASLRATFPNVSSPRLIRVSCVITQLLHRADATAACSVSPMVRLTAKGWPASGTRFNKSWREPRLRRYPDDWLPLLWICEETDADKTHQGFREVWAFHYKHWWSYLRAGLNLTWQSVVHL